MANERRFQDPATPAEAPLASADVVDSPSNTVLSRRTSRRGLLGFTVATAFLLACKDKKIIPMDNSKPNNAPTPLTPPPHPTGTPFNPTAISTVETPQATDTPDITETAVPTKTETAAPTETPSPTETPEPFNPLTDEVVASINFLENLPFQGYDQLTKEYALNMINNDKPENGPLGVKTLAEKGDAKGALVRALYLIDTTSFRHEFVSPEAPTSFTSIDFKNSEGGGPEIKTVDDIKAYEAEYYKLWGQRIMAETIEHYVLRTQVIQPLINGLLKANKDDPTYKPDLERILTLGNNAQSQGWRYKWNPDAATSSPYAKYAEVLSNSPYDNAVGRRFLSAMFLLGLVVDDPFYANEGPVTQVCDYFQNIPKQVYLRDNLYFPYFTDLANDKHLNPYELSIARDYLKRCTPVQ